MNKRNMNEYYADIRTELLEVIQRVYLREAPETKTFPYLIFDVEVIFEGLTITVDLWGREGGESELENYADSVEEALDGFIIANEYHTSMLNSNDDRKWIRDEDPTIIRIQMSFNATYQS